MLQCIASQTGAASDDGRRSEMNYRRTIIHVYHMDTENTCPRERLVCDPVVRMTLGNTVS